MRICVAVKHVPREPRIGPDGRMGRDGTSEMDLHSRSAMLTALSIRTPDDIVSVVTMGPPQAEVALRECLALGADKAFLLTDEAFAGADVWATARTLKAFFDRYGADVIFTGACSSDGGTAMLPAELAYMTGAEQFCHAVSVERADGGIRVTQDYRDSTVTSFAGGKCVVAVSGHPSEREASVADHAKDITVMGRIDLGLGAYSVGAKGSKTRIVRADGGSK